MNGQENQPVKSMSEMLGGQQSGLDSAIERVKEYIVHPNLVTPDTLRELLSELEDLKSEEMSEPDETQSKGEYQ